MEECERLSHAVHEIARLMLLANQDAQRVALRTSARTSRLVMAGVAYSIHSQAGWFPPQGSINITWLASSWQMIGFGNPSLGTTSFEDCQAWNWYESPAHCSSLQFKALTSQVKHLPKPDSVFSRLRPNASSAESNH